ncbi:hypothetical protein KPSA3_04383 [Pseudomonas syringae pv. actinidiae]|nr:hypothetical protein KPSA3_04383 [Pseudomonas syringae pv. actinidiae]
MEMTLSNLKVFKLACALAFVTPPSLQVVGGPRCTAAITLANRH